MSRFGRGVHRDVWRSTRPDIRDLIKSTRGIKCRCLVQTRCGRSLVRNSLQIDILSHARFAIPTITSRYNVTDLPKRNVFLTRVIVCEEIHDGKSFFAFLFFTPLAQRCFLSCLLILSVQALSPYWQMYITVNRKVNDNSARCLIIP